MDKGAQQATVHGISNSEIRLKPLSRHGCTVKKCLSASTSTVTYSSLNFNHILHSSFSLQFQMVLLPTLSPDPNSNIIFLTLYLGMYESLFGSLFGSVTQSCPTLYDSMDCSMPGLLVHHQLLEFIETHVH